MHPDKQSTYGWRATHFIHGASRIFLFESSEINTGLSRLNVVNRTSWVSCTTSMKKLKEEKESSSSITKRTLRPTISMTALNHQKPHKRHAPINPTIGTTPTNLFNDLIFQSSAPLTLDAGVGPEPDSEVELCLDEVLGPALELDELDLTGVVVPPNPSVVGDPSSLLSPLLLGVVVVVGRGEVVGVV